MGARSSERQIKRADRWDPNAMNKRVQWSLNGKAGGNDALQTAVARQRAIGHTIEVRVALERGGARRCVAEAGEVGLAIAAGGEGTLIEVGHGVMDHAS